MGVRVVRIHGAPSGQEWRHGSGLGYVRYMGTARVMMQHTRAMYVRVGVYAWLQWNMYCCVDCVNVFGRLYRLIQWWYVVV